MSPARVIYVIAVVFLSVSIFVGSEIVKAPFFGEQPTVGDESFAYILKLVAFLSLALLLLTPKIK